VLDDLRVFSVEGYLTTLGMVRVDDLEVIQCATQFAIHKIRSHPQNHGKGGLQIA